MMSSDSSAESDYNNNMNSTPMKKRKKSYKQKFNPDWKRTFSWIGNKNVMGRTKRRRSKKKTNEHSFIPNDQSIIRLQTWLVKYGWKNETKLILKSFSKTGRGLSSKLPIKNNDILITIPYNLIVTYTSLKTHSEKLLMSIEGKLTMHELLSLFLVYEKGKDGQSFWRSYIDSLPEAPPLLPWQASVEETKSFPPGLQVISVAMHEKFQKSFDRVKESIKKPSDCVFDENLFKWAYIMVNTRAVYVDPNLGCDDSFEDLLLDEPSIGLCPFLDMFNHHFLASTEAILKRDGDALVYQLKTATEYKKHDQVFISYGPHDNIKLLMEYGFFIPGNFYDTVRFQSEEVLKLLLIDFNQQEYRFLREHGFLIDLYIGLNGVSYNLKALLYVAYTEKRNNYGSVIFADAYPDDFNESLAGNCQILLDYKRRVFEEDQANFRFRDFNNEIIETMGSFIDYRLVFVDGLRSKFGGGKLS